jgi:hypothetical protein
MVPGGGTWQANEFSDLEQSGTPEKRLIFHLMERNSPTRYSAEQALYCTCMEQ